MTSYVFLLCIVVSGVYYTCSLPLPTLSEVETRTFRWTFEDNLNVTNCVVPNITAYFPNDTLLADPDSSTFHDCKSTILACFYFFMLFQNTLNSLALILLNTVFSQEDQRVICHGNNSLFVLIGNPGMIWHPQTGQCVHSKVMNISASTPGEDNRGNELKF